MSDIFELSKFTLVKSKGIQTVKKVQTKHARNLRHPFRGYNKKMVSILNDPFEITAPLDGKTIPKDRSVYSDYYEGSLRLVSAMFFIQHEQTGRSRSQYAVTLLNFYEHHSCTLESECISFHLEPGLEIPRADIQFTMQKNQHESVRITMIRIALHFGSHSHLRAHVGTLESDDAVVVAKLSS